MSKPIPYMQFYVADYLGDTQHLTTIQHGAYTLIIWTYWQRQEPPTERQLPYITRLTSEEFASHRDILAELFSVTENGLWKHKRIDEELRRVRTRARQNRAAGKASAAARKAKKQDNESTDVERALNTRSTSDVISFQRNVNQSYVGRNAALSPRDIEKLSKEEETVLKKQERMWSLESEVRKLKAELNEHGEKGILPKAGDL